MIMGLPLFLLFGVYGVVNAYLPILLFRLGYTASIIGVLQGVFEASGLIFPIFISSRVDRKGTYRPVMIWLGLLMVAVLPALVMLRNVWVTALVLALFAIGYKGTVPVADALVSRILGDNKTNYGKVRVMGSIGFVCFALLLQFTTLVNPESPSSIALWIAIPATLFSLSVAFVPAQRASAPVKPAALQEREVPGATAASETGARPSAMARGIAKLRQFPSSFWIGITLIFLGYFGLTPSQRFFSLYVQEYLHLASYSGLWALSAAAEVPFMFLSGWFIRKYGTEKIIVLSLFAITARNLVYACFPTFGGAVAGQLFHAICFGLFHPAAVIFVTERAPKHLVAVGLTLYTSVASGFASVLGNIAGGFIIDNLGYRQLFIVFSAFPLVGVAIFMLLHQRLMLRPGDGPALS